MSVVRSVLTAMAVTAFIAAAACDTDPQAKATKHALRADAYAAKKQYAEAIIEYGNALKATPQDAVVRHKLARVHDASGDPVKAYREYAHAADLDPSNLDAQMRAGSILLAAGEFERARTRAELVLKVDPRHVPALILLGNASAGLRDMAAALRQIEQAVALDPNSAPAWSALAAVKFSGGREREAAVAFRKAVDLAPQSPETHLALASFQWALSDRSGTEATLKTVLTIDSTNAPAHRALALLYLSTRRPSEAEPHFRAVATDAPGRLALADFYAVVNRTSEALQVVRELQKDAAKETLTAARLREGGLLYASGQKAEAHQIIDALLKERARNVDARLAKARMLLGDGAAIDATAQAREAVKTDGGNSAAHYVLGLALGAQRDFAAAERAFEEVARLNPRAAAAQMQLAKLRLARGDAPNAVAAAEAALQVKPGDIEGAVLLSRSLRAAGQYDRAARAVTGKLAHAPDAAPLHMENGWLALQRRDTKSARVAFTRVLAIEPSAFEGRSGLIGVDLAERKIENARAQVRGWRKETPNDARLRVLEAKVEIAAGELASAESLLATLISNEPSQLEAYQMLGSVYASQGKIAEAIAQYQRLSERSPATATAALTMIGMLKEGRGDRAGARSAYEQVVEKDPRAGVATNNLAWIYAEEGKLDRALQLATLARDAMGRRPEAEDTLGWVYLKKGMATEALASFERARGRAPTRAIYHYHAGLAHLRNGDRKRARAAFSKALELEGDFSGAQDAREKLVAMSGATP